MAKIDLFPLEVLMTRGLREHGYYPLVSFARTSSLVKNEDVFDALLSPQKSPYLIKGDFKTILQANATLLNMMFYAVYSGYLFASIIEDKRYDNQTWSYYYMHNKLRGHIYEPIFTSLIFQILDDKYIITHDPFNDFPIKDSRTVFSIVYRCIYSFITQTGLDNPNIYEDIDKESLYYKKDLPDVLKAMHEIGVHIFYAGEHDNGRQKGKKLMSKNLWDDLNLISF